MEMVAILWLIWMLKKGIEEMEIASINNHSP